MSRQCCCNVRTLELAGSMPRSSPLRSNAYAENTGSTKTVVRRIVLSTWGTTSWTDRICVGDCKDTSSKSGRTGSASGSK